MNLKEAQSAFEGQFKTVVRGGDSATAPNGLPYICVTGGGIKREGEPFPVKFAFEDLAAKWWLDAANEVANGKMNTLYWRHEPEWELEKRTKGPVGLTQLYGIVYSRFVTE
jgi:hypothetical protein